MLAKTQVESMVEPLLTAW